MKTFDEYYITFISVGLSPSILPSFLQIIFVNSGRINLSSSGSERRLQIDDVAVGMVLPPYVDAFCKFNRGSNPPAPSIFR